MTKHKRGDTDCVVFRPDSRNASKDYLVPRTVAEQLLREGRIYGDATNGGYMPKDGDGYDMRQHKVPQHEANRGCLGDGYRFFGAR